MRYGLPSPVVRNVGGLVDTVDSNTPGRAQRHRLLLRRYEAIDFLHPRIVRAWEAWRHPQSWQELQQRAMASTASWQRPPWPTTPWVQDVRGVKEAKPRQRPDRGASPGGNPRSESAGQPSGNQPASQDPLAQLLRRGPG